MASSVMESMQAFLMDWGVPSDGHRINIQQPGVSPQNAYTSVGVGIVQTSASNPSFGPMVVTQDFGSQANTQAQVVGVAYNDTAGTGFYLPGEGVGGVQIDAVNLADRRRQLHADVEFGRLRAVAGSWPVSHHCQSQRHGHSDLQCHG